MNTTPRENAPAPLSAKVITAVLWLCALYLLMQFAVRPLWWWMFGH